MELIRLLFMGTVCFVSLIAQEAQAPKGFSRRSHTNFPRAAVAKICQLTEE